MALILAVFCRIAITGPPKVSTSVCKPRPSHDDAAGGDEVIHGVVLGHADRVPQPKRVRRI
jgi:hypothetical protein